MPPADRNPEDSDEPTLTAIVERTISLADDRQVTVDRVVGSVEKTGFAALMLVPAIAVVTPLSGIPLFSSFCGVTITLIAAQWLLGRDHIWLPGWLRRRGLDGGTVRTAMAKIKPLALWLDNHSKRRARFLFRGPLRQLLPLVCLLFGTLMPVLELVPFSSSFLGAAVCLIAFSLMTRDGLYALAALLPVAAGLWGLYAFVG
jgi:hypothetical protein